jgi:hypothetical protein
VAPWAAPDEGANLTDGGVYVVDLGDLEGCEHAYAVMLADFEGEGPRSVFAGDIGACLEHARTLVPAEHRRIGWLGKRGDGGTGCIEKVRCVLASV